VLDLLLKGFTTPEIASQLGSNCKTTDNDIYALCQHHRVKGRKALIKKFQESPQVLPLDQERDKIPV
jgi:hypothetical protein